MEIGQIKLSERLYNVGFAGTCRENTISPCFIFNIIKGSKKVVGRFKIFLGGVELECWRSKVQYKIQKEEFFNILALIFPHISIPIELNDQPCEDVLFTIKLISHKTEWIQSENTFYLDSEETPEELVQEIAYGGEITEEKVQNEILKLLYRRKKEGLIPIPIIELKRLMFLEEGTFGFNMELLSDLKYIHTYDINSDLLSKAKKVTYITNEGVTHFSSMYLSTHKEAAIHQHYEYVGGDKMIATHGSNIFNKSNIIIINDNFDKLMDLISKEYKEEDKEKILKQVEEIKEKAKEPNNANEVSKDMLSLGARLANYSTIAQFLITNIWPMISNLVAKPVM